ncbi:MAG: hypothetical protein QXG02_01035 [Candidatus Anstonellales archaeon]
MPESLEKEGLKKDLEKIEEGLKNNFESGGEEVAMAIARVFGFFVHGLDKIYKNNKEAMDRIINGITEIMLKKKFGVDVDMEIIDAPCCQAEEEWKLNASDEIERCSDTERLLLEKKLIIFLFLAEGYARTFVDDMCEVYEEALKNIDSRVIGMIKTFFDFGEIANYYQYVHPPPIRIAGGSGMIKTNVVEMMEIDENGELKNKKKRETQAIIKATSFHTALIELGELEFKLLYNYIDEFLKEFNKNDVDEAIKRVEEKNIQFVAYSKGPEYFIRLLGIKNAIKKDIEERWPDTKDIVKERWFYHTINSLNAEELKKLMDLLEDKEFKRDEAKKIVLDKYRELVKDYE